MLSAASADLNTLNTTESCGWYVAGGGNTAANKPSGVDAFGLTVFKVATGYIRQMLYQGSPISTDIYQRTYNGSTWTDWTSFNAMTTNIATNSNYIQSGTLTYKVRNGVCSLYFQGSIYWENLPTTDSLNTLFSGVPTPANTRILCDMQVYRSTNVDVSSIILQTYSGIIAVNNRNSRVSGILSSSDTVYISCAYLVA